MDRTSKTKKRVNQLQDSYLPIRGNNEHRYDRCKNNKKIIKK